MTRSTKSKRGARQNRRPLVIAVTALALTTALLFAGVTAFAVVYPSAALGAVKGEKLYAESQTDAMLAELNDFIPKTELGLKSPEEALGLGYAKETDWTAIYYRDISNGTTRRLRAYLSLYNTPRDLNKNKDDYIFWNPLIPRDKRDGYSITVRANGEVFTLPLNNHDTDFYNQRYYTFGGSDQDGSSPSSWIYVYLIDGYLGLTDLVKIFGNGICVATSDTAITDFALISINPPEETV